MAERMYEPGDSELSEVQAGTRDRDTHETTRSHRRSSQGFAAMDPQKQREIASRGGRAAHQKGTAHQFTSEEARAAGRKGGEKVSQNREHMSNIGSRGGRSAHEKIQSSDEE